MKRMGLQSFYLKLNELKEYDQAKQERTDSKEPVPTAMNDSDKPIAKTQKLTKAEIRERIGLTSAPVVNFTAP
ncbi:unnamed protein product [Diamesa serratosioi]